MSLPLQQISKDLGVAGSGLTRFYGSTGNESVLLQGVLANTSGATLGYFVNNTRDKIHVSTVSLRSTVAVVTGSTPGTLVLKKAAVGTAIASASTIKTITISSTDLGSTTDKSKDYSFTASDTANIDILNPGDILVVSNTTASGGGAAGSVAFTIHGHVVE